LRKYLLVLFILIFTNSIFGSLKFTDKVSIQLLSNLTTTKNVEIDFMVKPKYSNFHIYQINYSSDWYFNNYKSDERYTSGFSFGTGIIIDLSWIDICGLSGYMYQTGYDNLFSPSDYEHGTFYLSIEPKIKLNNLYFCFSGNYYFNDVRINNRYKQYLLNFGIGINLF